MDPVIFPAYIVWLLYNLPLPRCPSCDEHWKSMRWTVEYWFENAVYRDNSIITISIHHPGERTATDPCYLWLRDEVPLITVFFFKTNNTGAGFQNMTSEASNNQGSINKSLCSFSSTADENKGKSEVQQTISWGPSKNSLEYHTTKHEILTK